MRKKQFKGQIVIFFIIFLIIFISCTRCVLPGSDSLKNRIVFMSYNTQNIFDDTDNGTEYPEFDPSNNGWGISQYNTRLFNLSETIRRSVSGGPDLIALQEIENERVALDLVEGYLQGLGYDYIAVTETDGSAIQLGFISRFELKNIKVHQILRNGKLAGRPILEASLVLGTDIIHVFNNHWKSKLGGAEETEPSRIASAALLSRRIDGLQTTDPLVEIVVLGDLNENWDEYHRNNRSYPTALIPYEVNPSPSITGSILVLEDKNSFSNLQDSGLILLFSPWCTYTERYGSYVYNDSWETIDHILLNSSMFNDKGFEYKSFSVIDDDYLLNTWGTPLSWKTQIGYGYSDHLPILLILER